MASPPRMALWLHHLHGLVHLIRPSHRLGIPPGAMPQRHSQSAANHNRNRTPALGSAAQFPGGLANHVARHPGTLRRLRPISQIAPTLCHRKRHGISPCVSGSDRPAPRVILRQRIHPHKPSVVNQSLISTVTVYIAHLHRIAITDVIKPCALQNTRRAIGMFCICR